MHPHKHSAFLSTSSFPDESQPSEVLNAELWPSGSGFQCYPSQMKNHNKEVQQSIVHVKQEERKAAPPPGYWSVRESCRRLFQDQNVRRVLLFCKPRLKADPEEAVRLRMWIRTLTPTRAQGAVLRLYFPPVPVCRQRQTTCGHVSRCE